MEILESKEMCIYTTPDELREIAQLMDSKLKSSQAGDSLTVFAKISIVPKGEHKTPTKVKFVLEQSFLWSKRNTGI